MTAADVTIPADVAKAYAAALRERRPISWPDGLSPDGLADLLDPRPVSLRDEAVRALAHAIDTTLGEAPGDPTEDDYTYADAVLAVVKARIEAIEAVDYASPWSTQVRALFAGGAS